MTALSHTFGLFNVDKCKIYPLTADPSGGSPTYGSGVFVPGIRSINIQPDLVSKELYGDAQILAVRSRLRAVKGTVEHARLNLDSLAIMLGGAVADTSVTPTRVASYTDTGAVPGVFKLEAQILGVDGDVLTGCDAHLIVYKATADTASLGGVQEDFAIPSFTFTGVALYSTGKRFEIDYNETAVALT